MTDFARRKRATCARALAAYGRDGQILKTIEELGELIVALMHSRKRQHDHESQKEIQGEIADCEIMLEQLRQMFNIGAEVDESISMKLARLEAKLDKEGL